MITELERIDIVKAEAEGAASPTQCIALHLHLTILKYASMRSI